jgi:hypothetical protein
MSRNTFVKNCTSLFIAETGNVYVVDIVIKELSCCSLNYLASPRPSESINISHKRT